MMMLVVFEFVSVFMLIISLLLLVAVLLKHFRGMRLPAYWVYYLGAFSLIAIDSAYTKLFHGGFETLDVVLRLVANLSILMGSYEIFSKYESSVTEKLKVAKKKRRRYSEARK